MFEELPDSEGRPEPAQSSSEEENKPARNWSRWSHVIAGGVFCLIYLPFQQYRWSWLVAVAVSYSVFTFAIALGLGLNDSDDLFGDSRAIRCAAALLLPHAPILAFIVLGAYEWQHVQPALPVWVTHARKVSLWETLGILVAWFAGTRQGLWMAGRIKRQLGQNEASIVSA